VMLASVYGVPDVDSGDQIMVAMVLHEGATFDPVTLAAWIDDQADLSPKWRPRYVRVARALPTTPTNKVLTRTLVHQKFRSDRIDGDAVYVRGRGEASYRLFTATDEKDLHDAFVAAGRAQAWDL
jgi:fatty-acyl-CoA synthase